MQTKVLILLIPFGLTALLLTLVFRRHHRIDDFILFFAGLFLLLACGMTAVIMGLLQAG